jgi:antitoxin component of RelBE/YafQ-DinJ toxin-antitoxin module
MAKQVKDRAIIAKVDEATKAAFVKVASDNNRSESDYLRLLVKYAIDKKLKF